MVYSTPIRDVRDQEGLLPLQRAIIHTLHRRLPQDRCRVRCMCGSAMRVLHFTVASLVFVGVSRRVEAQSVPPAPWANYRPATSESSATPPGSSSQPGTSPTVTTPAASTTSGTATDPNNATAATTSGTTSVTATQAATATPVATPGAAIASPGTSISDVLVLRDGSQLRGAALDVRVNESVTMRLADGTTRAIAWTEVSAMSGPGFRAVFDPAARNRPVATAVPVSASQSIATARVQNYLRPSEGTVPVLVESDGDPLSISIAQPITLPSSMMQSPLNTYSPMSSSYGFDLMGSSSFGMGLGPSYSPTFGMPYSQPSYGFASVSYQHVCSTPCTLHLRPGSHSLHVGGSGRRESDEMLEVQPGQGQRVRFRSSSRTSYTIGQTVLWVGVGSAVIGSLLLIEGSGRCTASGCDRTAAIGLIIAGALGVGIGIPLIVVNRTGQVERGPATRTAFRMNVAPAPANGGAGLVFTGAF